MTSSIMISPIVLLFNYASELARHIITLILVIWNFGLFKQNEQLSRINMNLMELNLVEEPELEVNIDFDEASCEWRRNKRYTGNGTFEYIKKEPYKKPKLDKLEIIHPDEISTDEEDTFHPSPPPAPRRRYVETPRHRYNTRLAAKNKKQNDERLSELLLLGC